MKFSNEPIVWIGAVIAVSIVVRDFLNGGLSMDSIDAAFVAVGALIGRKLVVPVAKTKNSDYEE
ncbi:hypothetical protein ACFY7C_36655 [Streptomyces sp. NPDC012769]|uniref:hypothetical protein n=1 Tax=Streptomyces sp. NPDC012769 TaxID=3364848 RepID=UPI00367A4D4E